MPTSEFKATSNMRINAYDPDLPLLASQAAIELDNLLLGKTTKFSATKELSCYLKLMKKSEFPTQQYNSVMMNASLTSAVCQALMESRFSSKRIIEEVITEATKVADRL